MIDPVYNEISEVVKLIRESRKQNGGCQGLGRGRKDNLLPDENRGLVPYNEEVKFWRSVSQQCGYSHHY